MRHPLTVHRHPEGARAFETVRPNAICQNCRRPAYLIAGVTETRCRRKIDGFMCESPVVPHERMEGLPDL